MKLHLPKQLLTALIACIFAGTGFTHAADYSVYTSTAITNPETGEEETPAYGYTIVNWQGGSTGTNGAGDKKAYGLCYAGTDNNGYRQATYDGNAGFIIADATNSEINGWAKTVTSELYRTILFDGNSNGDPDNDNRVFYDISNVKLSGIIVTGNSGVGTLWANNNARTTIIGKAGGATGYTTIAKNFTLDMNGSSLTLAGTQVWNVDESCVYTIKNAQNGNIARSADLTIGGAGTVSLASALTNNGTLTVSDGATLTLTAAMANAGTATFEEGAKLQIASLDGFSAVYSIGSEKSGLTTIDKKYTIYTGNAITGLNSFTLVGETQAKTLNSDGTYAATVQAYVIAKDITASLSSTEGLADAPLVAIAQGGTLNIDSELPTGWTAAGLLGEKVVGDGTLLISQSGLATGNADLTTIFAGTLELADGVTFTLGATTAGSSGDSKLINTSTLTAVELNNGSILQYHGSGETTLTNLTVNKFSDENIGKATLHYVDSKDTNSVNLTGVTQLNGNLDITTTYDGGFRMSQLSGAGALSITGGSGTFNATILSLQGYAGSLSFSNSALVATVSTGTGAAVDMGSITATGVSSFTFNVQENTSVDSITAAGGTVVLSNSKMLTLGTAGVSTTNSTIGTVSGTGTIHVEDGTLTIGGNVSSGSSVTLELSGKDGTEGKENAKILLQGADNQVYKLDFGKNGYARGVLELGAGSKTTVSEGLWMNNGVSILLESDATLTVASCSVTGTGNNSSITIDTSKSSTTDNYKGQFTGNNTVKYILSNVDVSTTLNSFTYTLTNSSLTNTGTSELTVSNANNTITTLTADKGNVKVSESMSVQSIAAKTDKVVTVANGKTVTMAGGVSLGTNGADAALTGRTDNALAQLGADATFSISDMALSNAVITTTEATPVVLQNVTATNTMLAGGKFTLNATPTVGTAATDDSTGSMSYSIGLGVQSGASLTLNLDVLSAVGAEQHGVYDITITLSGFGSDFTIESLEAIRGMVDFDPSSWLAKSLEAQGAVYSVATSETVVAPGNVPTVTYSAGTGENVGSLVIAINGLNVPEPTTATLSLLALAGLAARRRRASR